MTDMPAARVATVTHVRSPDRLPEEAYRQVLAQIAELSPVVQALPPTAALRRTERSAPLPRRQRGRPPHRPDTARAHPDPPWLRPAHRYGPNISVAAPASAQVPEPGGVLVVAPDQAAAWLAGLPVEALHGIGPRQAGVLHDYGIHTVVLLAAVPAETVQRLLGGRAGRQARERARGIAPPRRGPLPARLRERAVHLRTAHAGRRRRPSRPARTRRPPRSDAAPPRTVAPGPDAAPGLRLDRPLEQDVPPAPAVRTRRRPTHGRLPPHGRRRTAAGTPDRAPATGEELRDTDTDTDTVAQQITLDHSREARLVAEAAIDRVRHKFGAQVIGPAAAFRAAS